MALSTAFGSATNGAPLWHESTTPRPALANDAEADVAIVGAGYTGLWAAYYLLEADPSLRVVILEKEHVGFGASGRNGGWASAIFPISLDHVEAASSHRQAVALQHSMNETVDEIGSVLRSEGIDADYAKQGFLSLARSTAQQERARASVDGSRGFGLPDQWRLLSGAEASDLVDATDVHGGLFTEHCALIHPGKLVRGLAEAVERKGGRIYESTPVTSIESQRVMTAHGVARASAVIRATEGFTPSFKDQRRTLVPLYSLALATEPIPLELRQHLGLTHRVAFNDMRHMRVYAQMTADGRLVFGGRGAPYHFGSRVAAEYDTSAKIHAGIRETMLDFFPALRGIEVTHAWGGPLGVPRDWHPSVGLDRRSGLGWAGPYVGDGVTTSNLAGRILRNLVLERDDELNDLPIVNHRSPRWEPEPFRWLGVNLGLRAAALGDTEERRRGRPSRVARVLESLTGAH